MISAGDRGDLRHVTRHFKLRVGHGSEEPFKAAGPHGHDQMPRSRTTVPERVRRPTWHKHDVACTRRYQTFIAHEAIGPGDDVKSLVRVVMYVERRSRSGTVVVFKDTERAVRSSGRHQDADVNAKDVEHFGFAGPAVECPRSRTESPHHDLLAFQTPEQRPDGPRPFHVPLAAYFPNRPVP